MKTLTIQDLQRCVARMNKIHPDREIVCAGGAPSDILNGKPVKDIDIFIRGSAATYFEEAYTPLTKEFCGYPKGEYSEVEFDYSDSEYGCSSYGSSREVGGDFFTATITPGWHGYPVQLVYIPECYTRKPLREELMERFDFGIRRVWCDAMRLRATHDFWHDNFNKRLTYFGSGWGETTDKRLARIRAKYADYRFQNRDRYTVVTTAVATTKCSNTWPFFV